MIINIQTKRAARTIVQTFQKNLKSQDSNEKLSKAEVEAFDKTYSKKLREIQSLDLEWKLPAGGHMLSGDNVYQTLSHLKKAGVPLQKKSFSEGDVIQEKGEKVVGGLFITDGILVEEFEDGFSQVCLGGWMLQLGEFIMNYHDVPE